MIFSWVVFKLVGLTRRLSYVPLRSDWDLGRDTIGLYDYYRLLRMFSLAPNGLGCDLDIWCKSCNLKGFGDLISLVWTLVLSCNIFVCVWSHWTRSYRVYGLVLMIWRDLGGLWWVLGCSGVLSQGKSNRKLQKWLMLRWTWTLYCRVSRPKIPPQAVMGPSCTC